MKYSRKRKITVVWQVLPLLVAGLPLLSCGQTKSSAEAPSSTARPGAAKIFDAVAAGTLLEQSVAYPVCVEEQRARGLTKSSATFLDFVVDEQGRAGRPSFTLTKNIGLRCEAEVEAAIAEAVARLPRFRPTLRDGRAVPTRVSAAVMLPPENIQKPGPVDKKAAFPGGWRALAKALEYRPSFFTRADTLTMEVAFEVRTDGRVTGARVPAYEAVQRNPASALYALNKVRALPAFQPALRNGKPAVGLAILVDVKCPANAVAEEMVLAGTMPVPAPLPPLPFEAIPLPVTTVAQPPPTSKPGVAPLSAPLVAVPIFSADSTEHVYMFAEQMPALRAGGGVSAIADTLRSRVKKLLGPSVGSDSGKGVVSFVVGPRGGVFKEKTEQSITPAVDAAILAAVRHLPRINPGKQNGRQVAVKMTIPIQLPLR